MTSFSRQSWNSSQSMNVMSFLKIKAISSRLEVARMLKAGDIYEDIVKKTGASTATISRIKRCLNYGSGGYSKILERMAKKNPDLLKLSSGKK